MISLKYKFSKWFGIAVRILLLTYITAFAVPAKMTFQGKLLDGSGDPVNASGQAMTFKIYDAATGGSALWNEVQVLDVVDGVYSVVLGSSQPIDLAFDTEYYLGIEVGTDGEMDPRVPILSVGYAFRADTATHALTAGSAVTATNATNATYADTATYALNAPKNDSSTYADTAAHALQADNATNADNATSATSATTATSATSATTAGRADSATYADTAAHALVADSAGTAASAVYATSAGSATSATSATSAASAGTANNADSLGSWDASDYVRNNTDGSITGNLTVSGTVTAGGIVLGKAGYELIVDTILPVDYLGAAQELQLDLNGGAQDASQSIYEVFIYRELVTLGTPDTLDSTLISVNEGANWMAINRSDTTGMGTGMWMTAPRSDNPIPLSLYQFRVYNHLTSDVFVSFQNGVTMGMDPNFAQPRGTGLRSIRLKTELGRHRWKADSRITIYRVNK